MATGESIVERFAGGSNSAATPARRCGRECAAAKDERVHPRTRSRTCFASFSISSDLRITSSERISVVSLSLSCFCSDSTSSDMRVTSLVMASRFALSMARWRFSLRESSGGSGGGKGGGNWGGGCPRWVAQRVAADPPNERQAPKKTLRDERINILSHSSKQRS